MVSADGFDHCSYRIHWDLLAGGQAGREAMFSAQHDPPSSREGKTMDGASGNLERSEKAKGHLLQAVSPRSLKQSPQGLRPSAAQTGWSLQGR